MIKTLAKQLFATLVLFMLAPTFLFAEIIDVTGIAIKRGLNNAATELLRDTAIQNAVEKALIQINGAEISRSKYQLTTSNDRYSSKEGESYEQSSSFQTGGRTRYSGNVKIVKVIREWEEAENYYVSLKIDVKSPGNGRMNTGYLWARVNKPTLSLNYEYKVNRKKIAKLPKLQSYLRENINSNGLELSPSDLKTRYKVSIKHGVATSWFSELGTYKADCNIQYSIFDNQVGRFVKDASFRAGPRAGFSGSDAVDSCAQQLSSTVASQLVSHFGEVFNEEWLNGQEFVVAIQGAKGNQESILRDIVGEAYLVKSSHLETFSDGVLTFTVVFSGGVIELSESLIGSFYLHKLQLHLQEVKENKVSFKISSAN